MISENSSKLRVRRTKSLTMPDVIRLLDAVQQELSKDVLTESLASVVRSVSDQLLELRQLAIEVAQEKDAIRH